MRPSADKPIFLRPGFSTLLLILVPLLLPAQFHSIRAFTEYSRPLSARLQVNSIDAVGIGIDLQYAVDDHWLIGLRSGYHLYSVQQTDQLNRWGWRFWNDRYLNKIQADLKADPSLSAVIGSVQKMDYIPVTLHGDYRVDVVEELVIVPSVGFGAAFYQRRLYADETWTKNFPAAQYSFTYQFRNFAPAKKGNPLFAVIGTAVNYRAFTTIGVTAAVQYTRFLVTPGRYGYDDFLFTDELGVRIGLEFLY